MPRDEHRVKTRRIAIRNGFKVADWIPSRKEIQDADDITMASISRLDRTDDEAEADATARFMVAYWASPLHAAHHHEQTLEAWNRVNDEFDAILCVKFTA